MNPFSSRISTPVKQFARVWYTAASNALRGLQRQPRVVQVLVFLGLFAGTAWVDLAIDPDLSLFALYLIPTLYSAWFLGIRWGYVSCLGSALVCFIEDWELSAFYQHTLIPHWNLAERLTVLVVIVTIVNTLKGALEDEHEAERRGVQREFEIASEVQMRLLPSQAPDYPRLDFGFFYQPARVVGGDYYDFIPFSQERMGLAVGDGDVLVAYTDGVVEALNPQQEEFGNERLSNIIRSSLSFGAAEICKRIAEGLQAF